MKHFSILIMAVLLATGCKKYLETKPQQSLSTLNTLEDLQLLLDYELLTNGPSLTSTSSDEYYLTGQGWATEQIIQRRAYIWDGALSFPLDWNRLYENVFYANTILDHVDAVKGNSAAERSRIKGTALFVRAHAFYQLAQIFAVQYNAATAATDAGIVLRLNADFNQPAGRATIKESYDRIIADLEAAVPLMPVSSIYKHQPAKAAVHALLARVYLQMGEYVKAGEQATASLALNSTLIDYNSLSSAPAYPMGPFQQNAEVLYYFQAGATSASSPAKAKVDSTLYIQYAEDDLRKQLFFRENADRSQAFRGSYTGSNLLFTGLAIPETYLIQAECLARSGSTQPAMDVLNALLVKRWKTGMFVPGTANNAEEALALILAERRKEMLLRGVRWADLRRLNKDPRFDVTLTRKINADTYTLQPGDNRYVFLIPAEILSFTNLPQNPR